MPMNHSEIEQEIRSLREKVTIYEEILKETRRSEDRLFRLVVGVAFILIAANIWYNPRSRGTGQW